MTSPARAGSRKLAANPMTVARKAVPKWVGPIGASRYCQRSARSTYVSAVRIEGEHEQVGTRPARFSPHAGHIGVAKEERQQPEW